MPGARTSDPRALSMPWIDSPFFESLVAERALPVEQETMVRLYAREGFWILDDVGDEATFAEIERGLHGRYRDTATGYDQGSRAFDAWRWNAAVARLAASPKVLSTLAVLYGRQPIPFQTLNFEVGTQQRGHSDTIHFDSVPHGFMCGVWLALEDTDSKNGPLFYYPRSHKLPRFDFHDIGLPTDFRAYPQYEDFVEELVEASELPRRELYLQRGQAIIWAANLIHGGARIRDTSRTRLSQVTRYYFSNCMYYQPMFSDPAIGRVQLKDVVDIRTRGRVPNLYRGRAVNGRRLRPRRPLGHYVEAARHRIAVPLEVRV
jgi:hypothetical protein